MTIPKFRYSPIHYNKDCDKPAQFITLRPIRPIHHNKEAIKSKQVRLPTAPR